VSVVIRADAGRQPPGAADLTLSARGRWQGSPPGRGPAGRMNVPAMDWRTNVIPKNTICLWYDGTALDAAKFYAETFPDSAVGRVHRAPGDYPAGKQGDVLTVEFTVIGIPCLGLNGGPAFKHCEAFSFQVATDDQAETDRLWNAIVGNGGQEGPAAGARTSGACRGRSRHAPSPPRSPILTPPQPSALSRR
jgi:predicted 3-demethylubiquinone-9 3-methyltransferase (glyoxalase superfamily)